MDYSLRSRESDATRVNWPAAARIVLAAFIMLGFAGNARWLMLPMVMLLLYTLVIVAPVWRTFSFRMLLRPAKFAPHITGVVGAVLFATLMSDATAKPLAYLGNLILLAGALAVGGFAVFKVCSAIPAALGYAQRTSRRMLDEGVFLIRVALLMF